jgi:hypothetical protein
MGTGDERGKRPCRICRRWFMPNPRLKDRQKTCGDPECQRRWHTKKCSEWNRKNPDYFKSNYLQKKIIAATENPNQSPSLKINNRLKSGLPLFYVQEVISIQHVIIIEYFGQLLFRRFQEVLRAQLTVMTGEMAQLPP